jgi:putative ABC transport system permease protein
MRPAASVRSLATEIRFAARALRRRPLFSLAVVATLALGIGANTAIFTVVRAVVLRPLPFRDPERLVSIYLREPGSDTQPFSIADFFDVRRAHSFERMVAWGGWSANLTGVDEPVTLQAQWTSAGYFDALGIRAALGRTPLPEEERPGGSKVAMLSDNLWRTRFGGDPRVVGRTLVLNGEAYEVIGILPRELPLLANAAELVSPLVLETDRRRANRKAGFLRVLGRLAPGVTPEAASAELDGAVARLRAAYPDTNAAKQGVRVVPLKDVVVGNSRRMLLVLQAAVGLVLLIACTNLANLLLARVVGRRAELSLRSALGARRLDLVRQLLCESLVLALAGGLVGVALSAAGTRLLLALGPARLPRAAEVGLDLSVLAFGVALSLAAGIAIGLGPALHASSRGAADGLRGAGRGSTSGRASTRARAALVAAEVGLSLVLLVGAALLLKTLSELQAVRPGFEPEGLLSVQLSLPKSRYGTPDAIARFAERSAERLSTLPGVEAAAAASLNPLTQWRANVSFLVEGGAETDRAKAPLANYRAVGPGYFRTLGAAVLDGREVEARDTAASVPVVLVSRTLARRHFAGRSPIGARIRIDDAEEWRTVEIVGVVWDLKYSGLDSEESADVYVPYAQTPQEVSVWLANIFCLAVRTSGDPRQLVPSVRRELRALDPDVAASAIRPMEEAIAGSLAERRFQALLLQVFGAAALALALAGIYAVTAFSVTERTAEIGVRLSLGAGRGRILGLVARQGLAPVAAGLAGGLAASLVLSRLIAGLLYGVAARDPRILGVSALVLALAGCAAVVLPAIRASRIDPVRALRAE